MSRPRFLADHDLNDHIVTGVCRREPSIQVLRLRETGLDDRNDQEVLEYAANEGWILISHDVNTMPAAAYARLAEGRSFPGLFMVQQWSPVGRVIENLVLIWAASEFEEWKDRILFLPFD